MPNIRLYAEDAVCFRGIGKEKDMIDIISNYAQSVGDEKGHIAVAIPLLSDDNVRACIIEAFDQIEEAASNGDALAQKTIEELNKLLRKTDFPNYFMVSEDIDYNIRMANRGDPYSIGMLGDKFYSGKFVAQDFGMAAQCYHEAAEWGIKQAQYNLAGCYELGLGVEQNLGEAMKWYRKATENGLAAAAKEIERLKNN